jgi:hypothetical protein
VLRVGGDFYRIRREIWLLQIWFIQMCLDIVRTLSNLIRQLQQSRTFLESHAAEMAIGEKTGVFQLCRPMNFDRTLSRTRVQNGRLCGLAFRDVAHG